MPDNTLLNTGTGGDLIQSDVITTLNGGADATGAKAQRVKVGWGVDGTFNDTNATNPLPIIDNDITAAGSITAAAQTVAIVLNGNSGAAIQITGTWVGTLQFEGTLDGTNWIAINAVAASTSLPQVTNTVNGLFRLTPGGLAQMRVNATAWTSGTAVISIRASAGTGGTFINQIAPVKVTDGTNVASIFPATFLRTTDEPRQVFYDNFDSAPDTVNVWNSTQGSGGVAAAVVNGILSLGAGTLANGFSKILSIPSFKLPIPGWLGFSDAIALSDGAAPTTNVARYWGTFSSPAAPTTAAPITDGYVFEESTTGKLSAVVYAAGVRTLIADLSSSGTNVQPLDALYHRYLIYVRTDKTYYYIDGVGPSNLVATTNFQSPAIQTLGTGLLVVNGPTPPVSNIQIQCAGLAVWDTGKNATQVADGTFPWRKATISAAGAMSVNNGLIQGLTDTQLRASALPVSGAFFQTTQPVSLATNTPVIAAGSSIIGKVGIDQTTDGTTNAIRLLAETIKVIGTVNVAGTVPVSGTFFQATQPVSLATNTPDITDRAARLLGVVASITNALPTGANTIGAVTNTNLDVALSTRLKPADTLAGVTTVAAVTAITNALPAGTNKIGTVDIATAAATAKGTQGANFVPTQDAKDAGRNAIHFYMLIPVLTSATDTLQSLTGTKSGATVVATTTPAVVTTGKVFRVTRVAATYISTAVSGYGIVRLRFNTAGVVAITSPIAATILVGAGAPTTANSTASEEATIDEGWEFAAATGVGISVQGFAAVTATAVGYVLVSITGYEY